MLVLLPIHNVEKMRGADATLPDRVGPDAPLRRERQEIPMGELQDSLHCHTCSARRAGGGGRASPPALVFVGQHRSGRRCDVMLA